MKINWITITVNDFEASKEFYQNYLGMKAEREFSPNEFMTIAFFKTENDMEVELIYNKNLKREVTETSNVSIGVMTKNYEDLLVEARKRGIITVEPTILGGNMECFFVRDPNGVGIQIIQGN